MKSLRKALQILELFLETGDVEIRLSDLAKMSGLNIATVNRIVSVFVEMGYMSQLERRGRYVLGTKFLRFSTVIKQRNRIRDIAVPHLVRLNKIVEETVTISNWDGSKLVMIDEVHSKHPLRINPDPGIIIPLYCTGVGKVIMAGMTEPELEDYLQNTDMPTLTPYTITNPKELRVHLKKVDHEGVAYDVEERYLGISNVGAAVRDVEDAIAGCVGVLGPSSRLTQERIAEIIPDVKKCALQISIDLGYIDKTSASR